MIIKKDFQYPHPSIFAASSSSFGMDRKYVLRIMILNGIPRVASARIGAQ